MLSASASAAGKAAFAHPPKESIETGSGFSYKYITEKVKPISSNILEIAMYYFIFNLLY